MRRTLIFLFALLVFFNASHAFAQAPASKSNGSYKYRKILTITGAAGGFATGFYIGRAAYDTPDSGSKVWATSAISASIGGGGGFLIGWAIDKRRNKTPTGIASARFNVIPLVSKDTRGVHFAVGF